MLRVTIKSVEGAGYLGNLNAEKRRRERYIGKQKRGSALVDI